MVRLTDRQRQVARFVLRGWSDREIAVELGISPPRVKQIVAAIARKFPGAGSSRRRIREGLATETSSLAA